MKLAYKIVLMNLGIAVVVTCFFLLTEGGNNAGSDVALVFGLVCLGMSLLNLVAGIILLFTKEKDWSNGMFLSCAMLLVLSGISCGSGLSGMRF